MAEYRAYKIGADGHFVGFEPLVCKDDDEAISKARAILNGKDMELWSGARLIIRLDHREK